MSPALASVSLTTGSPGDTPDLLLSRSLAATQLVGEKHKDKYPLTGLLITETTHPKLPVITLSRQMTSLYKNHSPLNIRGKSVPVLFGMAFLLFLEGKDFPFQNGNQ